MIDLRLLRDDAAYRAGAISKGADAAVLDRLIAADEERRALQTEVETLRAELNAASKAIGRAEPSDREAKIAAAGQLKARLGVVEDSYNAGRAVVEELGVEVPNPAHPSVPLGGEDDYEVIEVVGGTPGAPAMDHAEYGEHMGWVDSERAARNMGSRFAYLLGEAVLLELALVQWTMSKLVGEGFTPVVPPVMVREELMEEAGFFPTDRAQVYELPDDELFLIGTSEVALAGLHRGDRLPADTLPRRFAGFSSCFRREAGTYGKDTRGIFRVHQFDKVEMFSYCHPDRSWDELENLRRIEQEILNELGMPYRVVAVAAGDLGAPAAKKYDCEIWLPSEGRYREITSCSNYTDYSARRMGTRVVTDDGSRLLHTLNGTACAVGRLLVFLMEHYQQPDGSFVVPDALRPFCGLDTIAARR